MKTYLTAFVLTKVDVLFDGGCCSILFNRAPTISDRFRFKRNAWNSSGVRSEKRFIPKCAVALCAIFMRTICSRPSWKIRIGIADQKPIWMKNSDEFDANANLLWKCPVAFGIPPGSHRIYCILRWNSWIVLQLNGAECGCVTPRHATEWPKNTTTPTTKISNSLACTSFFYGFYFVFETTTDSLNWHALAVEFTVFSPRCVEDDWFQLIECVDK